MNINTISGVDVDNRWLLHGNDLLLVDGYDNIFQAICNRLSCVVDDMAYFYNGYGSNLHSFMGKFITPPLMQEMAEEVVKSLSMEPRLTDVKCELCRNGQNTVLIRVHGTIDEADDFEYNFLLDTVTQSISHTGWDQTQLKLHIGLWDCTHQENVIYLKRGESILIQCRVLNSYGNPVPIGVVDYYIGGIHRSVEVENGRADLLFDFPERWEEGQYTIEAKYRGIGKFTPSRDTLTIYLEDRWRTTTTFRHENNYGMPWQEVLFPVFVKDIMDGNVTSGEVYYYLNWTQKLLTTIDANNIYATVPTKGKAVWSRARVYDEWDNDVLCGCVNFYIDNLDGMLLATKTMLENGYVINGEKDTFLQSFTYNADYEPVCGGNVNFSYREWPQELSTNTEILDEKLMMSVGHNARVNTLVTDEDNIGVLESDVDYYVRKCGLCSPHDKEYTFSGRNPENVTVRPDKVAVSLDELPIAVTTHDIDAFRNGARYGAMIVDANDNVIDMGTLVTEKGISNYVSDTDDNDDEKIKFKLTGVDNNG